MITYHFLTLTQENKLKALLKKQIKMSEQVQVIENTLDEENEAYEEITNIGYAMDKVVTLIETLLEKYKL